MDAGGGWLVFDAPKVELAIHPGESTHHDISFFCDELEATTIGMLEHGDGEALLTVCEDQLYAEEMEVLQVFPRSGEVESLGMHAG